MRFLIDRIQESTFFRISFANKVRYKNRSALCKDYLRIWKQGLFEISTNVLSISKQKISKFRLMGWTENS